MTKPYEPTEAEIAELVDGYRDYDLAEITMRVAQKKLVEYLQGPCNHALEFIGTTQEDIRGFKTMHHCDKCWRTLLKDFGL